MSSDSRIVALDLALVGAAAWREAGEIRTRHFVLARKSASVEEKTANLLAWLQQLFLEIRPSAVSVEDDTGRGAGARTLRGYQTTAMLAARAAGASYRCDICASRARKVALGTAAGGKTEAVARARVLYGLGPELTDDEVDAAVLLIATEQLTRADEMLATARRETRMREAAARRATKKRLKETSS